TKFLMRFSSMPIPPELIKHLLVANIDGTGLTRLNTPTQRWHHPSWMPGGNSILFCDRDQNNNDRFHRIDCDNRNLQRITDHPLRGHPIASPNGKYIVTDENHNKAMGLGIYLLDLAADKYEMLASITVNFKRSNAHPVWNHDSEQILYHSDHTGFSNLYLIDLHESI
ncbi:MAG: hypothetical protein FWD53_08520, partial [Phycisphaerales bacterium]|nr:hypothetical protein [Phycisphaerales bacterium]